MIFFGALIQKSKNKLNEQTKYFLCDLKNYSPYAIVVCS